MKMKLKDFNKMLNASAKFNIPDHREAIPVTDFVAEKVKPWFFVIVPKVMMSVSTIAVLFLVSLYVYLRVTPVTLLTIDINPSISITLNAFNRVVDYEGNNQESEEFVSELKLKNNTISQLLEKVYDKALTLGYISEGDSVALIGIYGVDFESELLIKESLDSFETLSSLILLEHDSTIPIFNYMTSSLNVGSSIVNNNVMAEDAFPQYFQDEIIDSSDIEYSFSSEAEEIAAYVYSTTGISSTKLSVAVSIFVDSNLYETVEDFQTLLEMDIAELIEIYETLE